MTVQKKKHIQWCDLSHGSSRADVVREVGWALQQASKAS
jgi:hypothetical protein